MLNEEPEVFETRRAGFPRRTPAPLIERRFRRDDRPPPLAAATATAY